MTEEAPTIEQESPKTLSLLARESFGNDYKGEVAEPEVETEEEVSEEGPFDEAPQDEGQEVEQEEESSTDFQEYELAHIAQMLGVEESQVDVDDDGKVVFVSKVDGETSPLPARHMLDNAQMNAAADKRLEDVKAKIQTQNQEFEQQRQALEQQFVQAGKLIENAEKLIDRDSDSIDWKSLREEDPAEYSAKKAEIAERRQEIERMKQEAVSAYDQAMSEGAQQSQEERQRQLQKEQESLLAKLPEWKDPEKAKDEKGKLAVYLKDQGFSDHDIQAASDHRLIVMAHKARLWDEGQKKADVAKKKVAKVPKVIRPGAAKSKQETDSEKAKKYRGRLSKSGSIDDAFAYLKSRRGG